MKNKKPKANAKAKKAGKTNQISNSVVKCEVKLESGEWISPNSCEVFYIDDDAKFPKILYEIKTDREGPYEWSWDIQWTATACPQSAGKPRFKAKKASLFKKSGTFSSDKKSWQADFEDVIGGDITVKVKVAEATFTRKTFIRGKNPSIEKIHAELDLYENKQNTNLLKKIYKQESNNRQFYSDELPLVSFDNGYGLGQLTVPEPSYEEIWNWKVHSKYLIEKKLPACRSIAKKYLDQHIPYTDDMLDLETLAVYNGLARKQRYHNWNETTKL